MNRFEQILVKYWGYTSFRSIQEDVIDSVCRGQDTMALMPTGGGKSITFQVATLAMDGICIVVTPLIALMKDQVDTLRKKGIKAAYLHSGMRHDELSIVLDNCVYGGYKFLYVSPERLSSDIFLYRITKMTVCLIAVDEAHCISQWGYDFRPSYLRIAELRDSLPGVPVLAVTATATPQVADDIQKQLRFKVHNAFSVSFERKNLSYIVRKKDDKLGYLLATLAKNKGAGIIYVRNRRKTQEIATELFNHGVSADFYHAGLEPKVREEKQNRWKNGSSVMVCTNAFGMGIDKPDVRFVVHIDLPDSPEAYFQEAGRAGRDGKPAYAVLLYIDSDVAKLEENASKQFPPIEMIKRVYHALGNFFQIPVGSGAGTAREFNIMEFCGKYKLPAVETFSCIRMLEQEGYIELSDSMDVRAKVRFIIERDDLYKYQVKNQQFDGFIKMLLRTYSGIFTDYAKVDEDSIASKAGVATEIVKRYLTLLDKQRVINYYPASRYPMMFFSVDRLDIESVHISHARYAERKARCENRVGAMVQYVTGVSKCRSQYLLSYFGQADAPRCGTCDVCQGRNTLDLSKLEFDQALAYIKQAAAVPVPLDVLADNGPMPPEKIIKVLDWLIETEKVLRRPDGRVCWHS